MPAKRVAPVAFFAAGIGAARTFKAIHINKRELMCLRRQKQKRYPEIHVVGRESDEGQVDDVDAHERVRAPCLTFHPLETLEMSKDRTDDHMLVVQALIGLIGIGGSAHWFATGPDEEIAQDPDEPVTSLPSITVQKPFSSNSQVGKAEFDAGCSASDGVNVFKQEVVAPPLDQNGCELSHHGDESLQRALAFGVRLRLWPFGSVPAVRVVTFVSVAMNVAHVRKLRQVSVIN
ncbi:MAG: hypothetical protein OXH79_02580 [Boseongicola sp.]|nr:hypothetical protein [Boseongicola sp.]